MAARIRWEPTGPRKFRQTFEDQNLMLTSVLQGTLLGLGPVLWKVTFFHCFCSQLQTLCGLSGPPQAGSFPPLPAHLCPAPVPELPSVCWVEWVLPLPALRKPHVHLRPMNVRLFGNRSLQITIKCGHIRLVQVPIPRDWCPFPKRHTDTQGKDGWVQGKAEVGGMHLPARS